jgi:predicted ribosomally synthesized peptide with SipW-like signal peptide
MTGILNARIIASIAMLVFVGAAIAASTGAFFSDTESSTGNTFTAGEVDITISGLAHEYNGNQTNAPIFAPGGGFTFGLSDLKPRDEGTITYGLTNSSNEIHLCAAVVETSNDENARIEPEVEAGDTTDGPNNGELGQFLSFKFGSVTGTLNGAWQSLGTVAGNGTASSSIEYCFGVYDGGGQCVLDNGAPYNRAQTDSLTANVHFYAVQTRNNASFSCSSLPVVGGEGGDIEISQNDLFIPENPAIENRPAAALSGKWFFYNDKPLEEGVMTINQFAGSTGANEIVAGPGSEGAAYMKLHNDVDARYNIATYQFSSTTLSSIGSLKYRVYDESPSSQTPFLNFNVSFDGADTWQKRLVQVPAGVTPDTWTEVDALAGMWSWSGYAANGNKWPDNNTNEFRTWNDIKAAFPNASIRKTDSFFGVRVGHPGPIGEESYVDWIEFDGVKYDFEN